MAVRYMIIKGDKTTHGGTVLEGHESYLIEDAPVACMGHQVYCPQCGGNYPIVEGTTRNNIFGQPAALEGMKTACGAELISSQRLSSVEIDSAADIVSNVGAMTAFYSSYSPTQSQSYSSDTSYHSGDETLLEEEEEEEEISPIRQDAEQLMLCAQDICDKHLYYPEVKQAFMDEVDDFAEQIVHDVESGKMAYEDGAQALKKEEKSLFRQAFDLSIKGIAALSAVSQIAVGMGLCFGTGGLACAFGAPLIFHGANTLEETVGQALHGDDYVGITRKGYHYIADFFGLFKKECRYGLLLSRYHALNKRNDAGSIKTGYMETI